MLNAIENIDQASALLEEAIGRRTTRRSAKELIVLSIEETDDAIRVLEEVGLHLDAVAHLKRSGELAEKALRSLFWRSSRVRKALQELQSARDRLVAVATENPI